MTEICIMCCTAQPISTMRRDGAAWECADEIACIARRHDLITVMQRGLDAAWRVLDELMPWSAEVRQP